MNKKLKMVLIIGLFFIILCISFTRLHISQAKECKKNAIEYDQSMALTKDKSVQYYSYKGDLELINKYVEFDVIDIDLSVEGIKIVPYQSDCLSTVKKLAEDQKALAAINAGFFDYMNGMSVSYVIIDKKIVGDPSKNENLTSNPQIKPYLDDIYNRAEFKILDCNGKKEYIIDYHNRKQKGCELINAIQGGPMMIPIMDLEKEAFLVLKNGEKVRESANVTNPDARIAIGLTPDNHMLWVLEFARLLKHLNIKSAMGFDGGSSTTMYMQTPEDGSKLIIGDVTKGGKRVEARVKSILMLKTTPCKNSQ
jgi:hypothetical protein